MHEVSLVAELLDECERRAAGRTVRLVRIRHASSIPEAALQQAFQMLTGGSRLSGASLEAEAFDVELNCMCGFSGALGHDDLITGSIVVCPRCGNVSKRARTAEIELVEVGTTD
jgi:Zn finger protein HypA/HybF involved in hydrogenase expression